jgi:uncharacterized protein YlzI (FlbEa/FlbD family)
MDDTLKLILEKLTAIENKIDSFRETQEVTNKLLSGDTVGIKNQVRDMRDDMKEFRREVRDWTRSTDRKIDTLEDRLDGVRDALN